MSDQSEWWHRWEQTPQLIAMSETYGFSPDDFYAALSALKQLFTAEWLRNLAGSPHPLKSSLLEPKNFFPWSGLKAIHLGYAINTLGQNRLSTHDKTELQKPANFETKAFELEVLTWLKSSYPYLRLEHELGLGGKHKPDAMLEKGLYGEIRNLQTSKINKALMGHINELGYRLEELVASGEWETQVDLGAPKNPQELDTAYKNALAIIRRASPPFDEKEGNIRIQMRQVAEKTPVGKIVRNNYANLPSLELDELRRIINHLINGKEKIANKLEALPKGSSLIIFFRPTTQVINLMLLEQLGEKLFKFAIDKDTRVKAIRRIYIEVWRGISTSGIGDQKTFKTNPFVFHSLDNPLFSLL